MIGFYFLFFDKPLAIDPSSISKCVLVIQGILSLRFYFANTHSLHGMKTTCTEWLWRGRVGRTQQFSWYFIARASCAFDQNTLRPKEQFNSFLSNVFLPVKISGNLSYQICIFNYK